MRSLDNSLPTASPSKQHANEPPEQLLGAFKAAALAVTNLYKVSAADQGRARAEGYQDALDDLLAFLDKEDIGLSDGEGWRIRRWATERLDGRAVSPNSMETDDQAAENQDRGSSSPEITRSHSASRLSPTHQAPRTASPVRSVSQPPPTNAAPPPTESLNMAPPQGSFTFRSSYAYPQVSDIELSDLDLSDNVQIDGSTISHTANPPITVTRPHRTNSRHNNHTGRPNARGGIAVSRGAGAGQKRKLNLSDFFDISNSRDYRDGKDGSLGGGGKRGRYA